MVVLPSHVVDEARLIAGPKAVVNVYDGGTARARVEHGEKCRDAAERGAVSYARRACDHGAGREPAHHARECSLHASHGYDDRGALDVPCMREQPVDARYACVVHATHLTSM